MPGFESLTPPLIAWIVAVIVVSGVVQGALGLGFPTLATPLIAVVTDIRTAVILVLLPCIATVLASLVRSGFLRQALAQFWMMPIYMVIGAAVGTRLFIAFPEFPYALLLAGVIVVYLNLERIGRGEWKAVRDHRRPYGAAFGLLAGLSEGTANVAAPPLVVYYLAAGVQPAIIVQALNICFLTGKTTQFATLATAGGVTATQWAVTLPLAAVAAAGALYGIRIRSRIDAPTYKRWL
ncbi:MAG: sulfite exporter TauE/SafE family protein, partial [Burkholderiales bacterium]